jgi:hypothetical protein
VSRPTTDVSRFVQIAIGGLSGLTAVALILGASVADITTSTRHAAAAVVAAVTVSVAIIGGLVMAHYLSRLGCRAEQASPPSRLVMAAWTPRFTARSSRTVQPQTAAAADETCEGDYRCDW